MKKLFLLAAVAMAGAIGCIPLLARADNTVSQGYQVQGKLLPDTAVILNQNTLSLANSENRQFLYGVVVNPGDASVNINPDTNRVQVVTSGITAVAVSDLNGDVKSGDQLTPSPIAGVVMKATSAGRVLGVAQGDFNSQTTSATKQTITAKDGSQKQVQIGTVSALISVSDYKAGSAQTPQNLAAVQGVLSDVVGKDVSLVRTLLAIGVFVVAFALAMIIVYSAATGGIRSIGRNPLARNSVLVGLLQVVAVVVLILFLAFGAIFVIIHG